MPKPIFIGGINRSGTTLVRKLIGSHSRIALPPKEFKLLRYFPAGEDSLAARERFNSAVSEVLAWDNIKPWGLDPVKVLHAAEQAEPCLKSLYLLFLDQFRLSQGKEFLGEKTTHLEKFLPVFEAWFCQDFKFVHVVRHPYDVFASQSRAYGKDKDLPALPWARKWFSSAVIALTYLRQQPEYYKLVRYEDLIKDPYAVVKDLCLFLGVDFEPQNMIEGKGAGIYTAPDNSSFKDMISPKSSVGLIRTNDNISRRDLIPLKKRQLIANSCGLVATALGYHLDDRPPLAPYLGVEIFSSPPPSAGLLPTLRRRLKNALGRN